MNTKKMVLLAMIAAIAYMLVCVVRIPVLLFLSYEPKDVVITIGGFLFGPLYAFVISLVVSLLEMVTISDTGIIGCVMNTLSTCAFACMASGFYWKKRTLSNAIFGLIVGSVTMTAVMLLWNWLLTPLYMGWERQAVEALLLPAFLPFNLLKAGLNTALILALYKPLVNALRKLHLVEPGSDAGRSQLGVYILAAAILATCIGIFLVL